MVKEHFMRQGYVTVAPTVRIREEKLTGGETEFVLCIKSGGGLSREEIEVTIPEEKFAQIEKLIGRPLIPKLRRTYLLPDGLHLEVNHVDEGQPTEFWYAEIEYQSEEQANAWTAGEEWLKEYLSDDVTGQPGQTMGAYWTATRLAR